METTENTLSDPHISSSPITNTTNNVSNAAEKELDALSDLTANAPGTKNVELTEPTITERLRDVQDSALKFLANASNETLGACAVGLCASTYLVLGRVGLVLIGTVGGIVLHATWENSVHSGEKGEDGQIEAARRRKELGLEVAKRVLDWRDARHRNESSDDQKLEDPEASLGRENLDYSGFQPATSMALTNFTDAVIKDYVKWWYGPILPQDDTFPAACRQTFTAFVLSLSNHLARKREVDPFLDFMANATSILIVFLNELSAALRASPNQTVEDAIRTYLEYSPDSSLANVLSAEQHQKKLGMVAEDILESFLESKSYKCAPVKAFLQEVLSKLILQATIDSCSKAEWINGWIIYLLEDGEPELMNVIDAGVENLGQGAGKGKSNSSKIREDKKHQRRISKAEEAMQEAMREAQRMNEMIAEEDAQRKRNEMSPDVNETASVTTTDASITTPVSETSDPSHLMAVSDSPDMVFDHEGNVMPSGMNSPAKLASPVAERKPFTDFDQLAPQAVPTALLPESTPPLPTEVMVAIPLTLHNAAITLLDIGTGSEKSKIKSKPADEMLIQIEPASSRFSGWMASRKYVDFEALHETLRRIAVISGVPEFGELYAAVPAWQGKTRVKLISDLELYLRHAVKHERLAESEAMKKFLEKDTGLSKVPVHNKNVLLQGAAALDNVGKGFINALGQGGKGIAGGGKAVLGGVQGVFGAAGPKKGQTRNNTSISKLPTANTSNPRLSHELARSSTEPSESRPSLVSRPSASSFEHVGSSSPSQASLSQEKLNLPPPPSEIADEYPGFNRSATSPQDPESPTKRAETTKEPRPATPTQSSKTSISASPVIIDPSPTTPATTVTVETSTDSTPISSQPKPIIQPSRSNAKRKQPLTEEETRITVDLMFAIITSTYALSSAWTIRLSLLSAAKSYLLRPNNPQLESIRTLIQDSLISSNTTDASIATHINRLRENSIPTEEELSKWPAPLDDKQKEEVRIKARKLLIERGMPQALTSVMGQAASSESLGKVFDCLQIENVAKGVMFAVMLQGVRAVMQ